jgi:hypothetical protein
VCVCVCVWECVCMDIYIERDTYTYTYDWRSLCLHTTPHQIFEFFSPHFEQWLFRNGLQVFLRRKIMCQCSLKLGVFLVSFGHPELWGIRRWVRRVIILQFLKNILIEKQFHSQLFEVIGVSFKISLFKTTIKTTKLCSYFIPDTRLNSTLSIPHPLRRFLDLVLHFYHVSFSWFEFHWPLCVSENYLSNRLKFSPSPWREDPPSTFIFFYVWGAGKKGGKSTGDGGNGGNCTGVAGWNTGALFLSHWCERAGVQGSSDEHLHPSGPREWHEKLGDKRWLSSVRVLGTQLSLFDRPGRVSHGPHH